MSENQLQLLLGATMQQQAYAIATTRRVTSIFGEHTTEAKHAPKPSAPALATLLHGISNFFEAASASA
jgi:hypothetical protein